MTLLLIRVFFLIISAIVGFNIGSFVGYSILGLEFGLLFGLMLIFVEQRMHSISLRGLSAMVFGLLLGIFMAKLISDILILIPLGPFFHAISRVVLTIIFSYLGAVVALRGKDEFNIVIPYVRLKRQDAGGEAILLDTSAIIDGRIMDIHRTNFLSGRLIIPRCVLIELQKLADSADDGKRQRGRRGMELLRTMQNDPKIEIHIHEDELEDETGVDEKLMKIAKILDAKICTTDFNMGRIASLQKIRVLNVNELVNAVRSSVFTGDKITVKPVKPGKEADQAIAYLEDGTMVVVSDARKRIGEELQISVSSVLQTQSGKMIFGKPV